MTRFVLVGGRVAGEEDVSIFTEITEVGVEVVSLGKTVGMLLLEEDVDTTGAGGGLEEGTTSLL